MNCCLYFLTDPVNQENLIQTSPALAHLLAVGRTEVTQKLFELALCHDFNCDFNCKPSLASPLAALAWLGEGEDPAAYYWLHADPVHLSLQRDTFILSSAVSSSGAPLKLSDAEAKAMLATLNQHFATERLQFLLSDSGRCYLRLEKTPEERLTSVNMSALSEASGRDISDFQPQGEDAAIWKKIINEIQMLLHEHPVNEAREARGDLAINSLWLSGGGVLNGKTQASFARVFANHPLAKGLAMHSNLPCFATPANAKAYLAQAADNDVVVVENARAIDDDWFLLLTRALRKRQLSQLTINLVSNGRLIRTQVKPLDLWKFWRLWKSWEPRPLRAE